MRGDGWSDRERKVARRAFDKALQAELAATMAEAKARAARAATPDDLWALEAWLGARRREIDQRFDYRYSQLTMVFGILIHQGRLTWADLDGLGADKLLEIRRVQVLWAPEDGASG